MLTDLLHISLSKLATNTMPWQVGFSLLSGFLGVIVLIKNYPWVTVAEYVILTWIFLNSSELNFTLTSFHTVKIFTSLIFFFADIISSGPLDGIGVLTFLMSSWRNPCHALVGVNDFAYHYTLAEDRAATSEERSLRLVPKKHSQSTSELRTKMFFAPCVGFAITSSDPELTERLQSCGKCQDWATVAVYTLSCHKYLSYSCVFIFRWGSWIFLVLSILFHFFPYGAKLLVKYSSSHITEVELNNVFENSQIAACFATNFVHMFIIAFDVSNLRTERLEDNDSGAAKVFKNRGLLYQGIKLLLLVTLSYTWLTCFPTFAIYCDFVFYFAMCIIATFFTHAVTRRYRTNLSEFTGDNTLPNINKKQD